MKFFLIGISYITSFFGSIALSVGILGLITLSRIYQPQLERSGILQKLDILETKCPEPEVPTAWIVIFRWGLGMMLPVLIVIIISMTLFKQKFWSKCGFVLKNYVKFVASVTFMDFLLNIPAMVMDISNLISASFHNLHFWTFSFF